MDDNLKEKWRQQFNHLIDIKTETDEIDRIFEVFEIVLGKNTNNNMSNLFKTVGMENFIKIIQVFEGRVIKYPTAKELEDSLLLSLIFYYKEVKHLNWDKIREKVPVDFDAHEYGMKVRHVTNYIRKNLEKIMKEFESAN